MVGQLCLSYTEAVERMQNGEESEYNLDIYMILDDQWYVETGHRTWLATEPTDAMKEGIWWTSATLSKTPTSDMPYS